MLSTLLYVFILNFIWFTERIHWWRKVPCWIFGEFDFTNANFSSIVDINIHFYLLCRESQLERVALLALRYFKFHFQIWISVIHLKLLQRQLVEGSLCPFGYTVSEQDHKFNDISNSYYFYYFREKMRLLLAVLTISRKVSPDVHWESRYAHLN
jgi:hypothetical protein